MSSPAFKESEARLHWRALGFDGLIFGYCAEIRFIGRGPPLCLPVANDDELIELMGKYMSADTFAMIGVNPRSPGFAGAGTSADVPVVQTIFLDIDVDRAKGTVATAAQLRRLDAFRKDVLDAKLTDLGYAIPPVVNSGNGFHYYFAISGVPLDVWPDMPKRVRAFRHQLCCELEDELKAAGARIDSTFDPARMAKVAGTAKPGKGNPTSYFVGTPVRTEDAKLEEALMHIDLSVLPPTRSRPKAHVDVKSKNLGEEHIPDAFERLVRTNPKIRDAFNGVATNIKDRTRSGQDLALVSRLIRSGIVDPQALAAILFNTPHKKAREHSNPLRYIERTIAVAFDSAPAGLVPGSGLKGIVGDPDYLNPAQDFRDGVAFFARAFIEEKTVEVGKGKSVKKVKVKVHTNKLITSDKRALSINKPPKLKDMVVLADVPGTAYQVRKANYDGGSRWRLAGSPYSIESFVAGKTPDVDLRRFVPALRIQFEKYVYFPDPGDHLLCALVVMLSYVYRLFSSVPYLHLHGPKGSAKTTTGRLFECLGFNGTMTTNCSAASLFRQLDCLSPLFILDETENMHSRERSGDDPRSDLLKGGYQRGAVVTRQDRENVNVTQVFDVFSPKVICNIYGLDDVLADRAIRIRTRRANRKEAEAIARNQPDINNPHWATYRDVLYSWAMQQHRNIAKLRDELEHEEIGFVGREYELWYPLFVLARHCDAAGVGGVVKELRELAERKRKDKEENREEGDEERLTRIIVELIDAKPGEEVEVTMDELLLAEEDETGEKASKKVLGRRLRTIGVPKGRRRTVKEADGVEHTTRVYTVSRKLLGYESV
jgi:hypothetical protein